MQRRNQKRVLNCILQIARTAASFGVRPPLIVQYELEIDAQREEKELAVRQRAASRVVQALLPG